MQLDFSGHVAIVSASSGGIGKSCALELSRAGAAVAICGRDEARLRSARDELEAGASAPIHAGVCDLFDAGSVTRFVEEAAEALGPADIVIANSVGPPPGLFDNFGDDDWAHAFEGAFLTTARLIRAALPAMRARKGGAIVGIQSSSVKQPIAHLTLSNGVRPGVAGLFKSLANQCGPDSIRLNLVLPGRILTERFLSVERSHGGDLDERISQMAGEVPLRRLGTPEEVADAVMFLASDRASYITGTVIQVDGGNMRGLF